MMGVPVKMIICAILVQAIVSLTITAAVDGPPTFKSGSCRVRFS